MVDNEDDEGVWDDDLENCLAQISDQEEEDESGDGKRSRVEEGEIRKEQGEIVDEGLSVELEGEVEAAIPPSEITDAVVGNSGKDELPPAIVVDHDEDDEDELFASILECEVLSQTDQEEEEVDERGDGKRSRLSDCELEKEEQQEAKKARREHCEIGDAGLSRSLSPLNRSDDVIGCSKDKGPLVESRPIPKRIETGIMSLIPAELLYQILKFLSSEDLVSCSFVCRFLNFAAADESLWRRLYCMRWGLLPPKKLREGAKKLYFQRDKEDMIRCVRTFSSEFEEYYIQMQVAKRSQAPHLSQVNDDRIMLDKTLADQVSIWKSSRGLAETAVVNHSCSGESCTYHQLGDVFVCEKTGNVHVCDDTCKQISNSEIMVCTISGRCFDIILEPSDIDSDDEEQQQAGGDEAEPFMGSGRIARAYTLGYECEDEEELEACLRFC